MRPRPIISTVIAVAVLGGCGGSELSGETEASTSSSPRGSTMQKPSDLLGKQFVSGEVAGYETTLNVEFLGGKGEVKEVSWEADCNRFGAEVSVSASRIDSGAMSATEIGCAADEEAVDEALVELFKADPTWRLDRFDLVIAAGGEQLSLVDFAELEDSR